MPPGNMGGPWPVTSPWPAALGICYHQRPGKCLCHGPRPEDMLMAKGWVSQCWGQEHWRTGSTHLPHSGVGDGEGHSVLLPPYHLWQVGELALWSWKQSYPRPSFASALGRADPVPCLDSTVELALHEGLAGKAALKVWRQERQPCFLVCRAVVWKKERCHPPPSAPVPSVAGGRVAPPQVTSVGKLTMSHTNCNTWERGFSPCLCSRIELALITGVSSELALGMWEWAMWQAGHLDTCQASKFLNWLNPTSSPMMNCWCA